MQRGYIVITWDPMGQGERGFFVLTPCRFGLMPQVRGNGRTGGALRTRKVSGGGVSLPERLAEQRVQMAAMSSVFTVLSVFGGLPAVYYRDRHQHDCVITNYRTVMIRVIFIGSPKASGSIEA